MIVYSKPKTFHPTYIIKGVSATIIQLGLKDCADEGSKNIRAVCKVEQFVAQKSGTLSASCIVSGIKLSLLLQ